MSTTNENNTDLDAMSLEAIEAELKKFETDRAQAPRPAGRDRASTGSTPSRASSRASSASTRPSSSAASRWRTTCSSRRRSAASATRCTRSTCRTTTRSSPARSSATAASATRRYFTVGNLVKYLDHASRQARHDHGRRSSRTTCSSRPAPVAPAASACTSPSTARRSATPASTASASCSSSRPAASSRRPATSVGLEMNPTFFWAIVKAILIGDVAERARLSHPPVRGGAGRDRPRAREWQAASSTRRSRTARTSLPMALYKARREIVEGQGRPYAARSRRSASSASSGR